MTHNDFNLDIDILYPIKDFIEKTDGDKHQKDDGSINI
jgi:hypothetical protein